jgi:hypothetical protein
MAASWIVEESVIRLYGFYSYHIKWFFRLGHVPVLVVITWAILICLACETVSQVSLSNTERLPLYAALVVLTDAGFIEPIAVHAGFWSWQYPGVFGVPLIGFSGWFFFAFLSLRFISKQTGRDFSVSDVFYMLFIIVGTHVLLALSWWLVFKWLCFQVNVFIVIPICWGLSLAMSYRFFRNKTGLSIRSVTFLLRLPAAGFFWAILIFSRKVGFPLVLYAAAFIPPYLVLLLQSYAVQLSSRVKLSRPSKSHRF